MPTLIIGPSCVGKTTFIGSAKAKDLIPETRGLEDVVLGFEFKPTQLKPSALIHYNLLHALADKRASAFGKLKPNLSKEPVLNHILGYGEITKAIVLIASREDLITRALSRKIAEPCRPEPGVYKGERWAAIISRVDFNRLYESLFTILDKLAIPYQVIFSSSELESSFAISARQHTRQNLQGVYISPKS
jgi:hypothetical protein